MLFLEVKFYAKADIASSRLHKVVIALVIVRLGGGGSFRIERSFAVDHPQVFSHQSDGHSQLVTEPFFRQCIAQVQFCQTYVGSAVSIISGITFDGIEVFFRIDISIVGSDASCVTIVGSFLRNSVLVEYALSTGQSDTSETGGQCDSQIDALV